MSEQQTQKVLKKQMVKVRPKLVLEKNNAGGYNVVFNPSQEDEVYVKIGLEYAESNFVYRALRRVLYGLVDCEKATP